MNHSRFSLKIRHGINDLRRTFDRSRLHFYISIGAVVIGLLAALFRSYADYETGKNFIYSIATGTFNPFVNILLLLFYTALPYLAGFISGFHFAAFLLFGYGGMLLASYLLWRAAMIAVAVSAFHGVLLLIFFIIPVFFVNWILLALTLNKLYFMCGYSHNRRFRSGFGCQMRIFWSAAKRHFCIALLFNFILWLLLTVLFVIIY